MKEFSTKLVLSVTNATENQLKYWVRSNLVQPEKVGKAYYYSFRDIVKIKTIISLKKNSLSLQKIRLGLRNLEAALPESGKILTNLIIYTNGIDMIVCEKGKHFSAITSQIYLYIDTEKIESNVIKLHDKFNKSTVESTDLIAQSQS